MNPAFEKYFPHLKKQLLALYTEVSELVRVLDLNWTYASQPRRLSYTSIKHILGPSLENSSSDPDAKIASLFLLRYGFSTFLNKSPQAGEPVHNAFLAAILALRLLVEFRPTYKQGKSDISLLENDFNAFFQKNNIITQSFQFKLEVSDDQLHFKFLSTGENSSLAEKNQEDIQQFYTALQSLGIIEKNSLQEKEGSWVVGPLNAQDILRFGWPVEMADKFSFYSFYPFRQKDKDIERGGPQLDTDWMNEIDPLDMVTLKSKVYPEGKNYCFCYDLNLNATDPSFKKDEKSQVQLSSATKDSITIWYIDETQEDSKGQYDWLKNKWLNDHTQPNRRNYAIIVGQGPFNEFKAKWDATEPRVQEIVEIKGTNIAESPFKEVWDELDKTSSRFKEVTKEYEQFFKDQAEFNKEFNKQLENFNKEGSEKLDSINERLEKTFIAGEEQIRNQIQQNTVTQVTREISSQPPVVSPISDSQIEQTSTSFIDPQQLEVRDTQQPAAVKAPQLTWPQMPFPSASELLKLTAFFIASIAFCMLIGLFVGGFADAWDGISSFLGAIKLGTGWGIGVSFSSFAVSVIATLLVGAARQFFPDEFGPSDLSPTNNENNPAKTLTHNNTDFQNPHHPPVWHPATNNLPTNKPSENALKI